MHMKTTRCCLSAKVRKYAVVYELSCIRESLLQVQCANIIDWHAKFPGTLYPLATLGTMKHCK